MNPPKIFPTLEIGRTQTLKVLRTVPMGLILGAPDTEATSSDSSANAGPEAEEGEARGVLLPSRYVPDGTHPGDAIEVFIYTDSEDRPIATTERPLVEAEAFAGLEVVSVGRMGAFLDWGLPKDLLLPYRAQWSRVQPGERVAVRVFVDEVSGRPVASSKVERFLSSPPERLRPGQPVELLIYHETDLGCKAIVDGAYSGLLYRENGPPLPRVGETARGFIRRRRPDGRVDLALTPGGKEGIDEARLVLEAALEKSGGRLDLTDASSPAAIRDRLGLSKKAFKRAVGALYRERLIRLGEGHIEWTRGQPSRESTPSRKK